MPNKQSATSNQTDKPRLPITGTTLPHSTPPTEDVPFYETTEQERPAQRYLIPGYDERRRDEILDAYRRIYRQIKD